MYRDFTTTNFSVSDIFSKPLFKCVFTTFLVCHYTADTDQLITRQVSKSIEMREYRLCVDTLTNDAAVLMSRRVFESTAACFMSS